MSGQTARGNLNLTILSQIKISEPIGWKIDSLTSITFGVGIKEIAKEFFYLWGDKEKPHFKNLEVIYVPAKKTEYYKARIPEQYHSIIVELPAEKKKK